MAQRIVTKCLFFSFLLPLHIIFTSVSGTPKRNIHDLITPLTKPVTILPTNPTKPATPVTVPVMNPSPTPVVSEKSWCAAKNGVTDAALQLALDYACGIGGADCSAIQMNGSCYNPNTLQSHASYAFNSYYQKNPVPTSCDFAGTATIVSSNPGSAACVYPSSSSSTTSGFNPPPAFGADTGEDSVTVLNINKTGGSAGVYGSGTPTSSTRSTSNGWALMLSFLATSLVTFGSFIYV